MTFSLHTATVNGIQLHYVMGGKGDPVVLLHGYPQSWYEWRHVMPALAKNYTVIAPDLRGFGDSSKPLQVMMAILRQKTSINLYLNWDSTIFSWLHTT
ncbi:MAG: alpha/beta fold hydrolase [Nitrososphaeraceae archaeon]